MSVDAVRPESYIVCELAGTAYALPSRLVQQMEMIEHITPVPNTPSYVEGVVFVRGQVVAAISLRRRFGFVDAAHTVRSRLVVLSHEGRSVGLVVDSAREFVSIGAESIRPTPEALSGLSGNYLQGIAQLGQRMIMIVNVEELLRFEDQTLPGQPGI